MPFTDHPVTSFTVIGAYGMFIHTSEAGIPVHTLLQNKRKKMVKIGFISETIPYHSRLTPEGIAEASQIFLRDPYVLPKLFNYKEYCRRDRW
jgi:hypothetical protein